MNQLLSIGIILHAVDKLSSPLRGVQRSVQELGRSGISSINQFSRSFDILVKTVEKAKKPFQQLKAQADSIKGFGQSMAIKGAANVMIGLSPTVSAAEFEKGLAEVATLTDMSVAELKDKYGKQILDLSQELGQAPELVVKGMYQAISAGVDPKEAIEFMRKAGKAAIAGVSDVFTATDLATSIKNSFNLPMQDMNKVYDVIFKTVQKGKTTFGEIAHSFQQVGASASSAGISFEHIQTAVAQMTLGGVTTDRAYTSLKYVIDALVAPADKAKKIFEKFGLEINAETLRQKDLLGIMSELKQAMSNLSEKDQAEAIADIFGSQEAQMFVKDFMTNTEKYKGMLNDITNSTGATEGAYKKMSETTAQQYAKLKETLNSLKIALGTSILPALNVFIGAIKKIVIPIAEFAQRYKTLSGVILGGFVAISAIIAVLGTMGIALGFAIKGYTNLKIAINLLTGSKLRLITAMKGITSAFLQNVTGTRGLIAAIRAFSMSAITAIRSVSIALLTTPIGWLALAIGAVAFIVYKYWKPIAGFFKGLWQGIKDGLKGLEPAWNLFKKASSIVSPIISPLKYIYSLIKSLLKPINDTGKAAESLGLRFGKAISGILSSVLTLPTKMFSAGAKIVTGIYDGIKSAAMKPVEAIKGVVQKIRNFLPFSPAKEGALKDLNKIKLIETIAETIKPSPLLAAMSKAVEPVKAATQQAKTGAKSSTITVNYNPTLNISGATASTKEDFLAILKQHQAELLKLIQDAQAKQARLAY